METKLPKPKRLTLRRKSDGATQFPHVVTEENAAEVVLKAKLRKLGVGDVEEIPDCRSEVREQAVRALEEYDEEKESSTVSKYRALESVQKLTQQILEKAGEATELYRKLVSRAADAIAAGATEAEVRQEIIGAGWTASRASEVLKVASLPEPDLRRYLEEGMSWRLALSTARLSPLLRDGWDAMHAGLFADDLPPAPAPTLRDLPPVSSESVTAVTPSPVVVADGLTLSVESSPAMPLGEPASDPSVPAHRTAWELSSDPATLARRSAHLDASATQTATRPGRGPAKPADVRIFSHLAAVAKLFRKSPKIGGVREMGVPVDGKVAYEVGGYRFTMEALTK